MLSYSELHNLLSEGGVPINMTTSRDLITLLKGTLDEGIEF